MGIIEVYTDISYAGNNSFGIGIFIILPNGTEYSYSINSILLEKEIGLSKNTILMEIYGVYYSLEKINSIINRLGKHDVIIYNDCLLLFNHFNKIERLTNKRGNRIYFNLIVKIEKQFRSYYELRFLKSHEGIYGNVKADKLANSVNGINIPSQGDIRKYAQYLYEFKKNEDSLLNWRIAEETLFNKLNNHFHILECE